MIDRIHTDVRILEGDVLSMLKTLPDESPDCVITSPPYWCLRDYGFAGQMGLEATPREYIRKMVKVFRAVRRGSHLDRGPVVFTISEGGYWIACVNAATQRLFDAMASRCEVIGNIHENPELLKR